MRTKPPKPPLFHEPLTKEEFERVGVPRGITHAAMARWLGYADESGFRKLFKKSRIHGTYVEGAAAVLFRLIVAVPHAQDVLNGGNSNPSNRGESDIRALVMLISSNGRGIEDWRHLRHSVVDFQDENFIGWMVSEGIVALQKDGSYRVTTSGGHRYLPPAALKAFEEFERDSHGRFVDPLTVRLHLVNQCGERIDDD